MTELVEKLMHQFVGYVCRKIGRVIGIFPPGIADQKNIMLSDLTRWNYEKINN